MTEEEFRHLNVGDLVRHRIGDKAAVVTANFGDRVMAIIPVDLTNADEWELVAKASYQIYRGSSTTPPTAGGSAQRGC